MPNPQANSKKESSHKLLRSYSLPAVLLRKVDAHEAAWNDSMDPARDDVGPFDSFDNFECACDIPDKNFMQVAFFCCFRQGVAGMSRDLGRDVPDLEKLYARNFGLIFRTL